MPSRYLEQPRRHADDPFHSIKLQQAQMARLMRQRSALSRGSTPNAGSLPSLTGGASSRAHSANSHRPQRSVQSDIMRATREDEMLFRISSDGSMALDYPAFRAMVCARLTPGGSNKQGQQGQQQKVSLVRERRMRKWFDALDADGNGVIDAGEFLMFALAEAVRRAESSLATAAVDDNTEDAPASAPTHKRALFASLFQDQGLHQLDGTVGRKELSRLVESLGFGNRGEELFDSFAPKGQSRVAVVDLLRTVHERTSDLCGLVSSWARAGERKADDDARKRAARKRAAAEKQAAQAHRRSHQQPGAPALQRQGTSLCMDANVVQKLERRVTEFEETADVRDLLADLRAWLKADGARAHELFHAWDDNGSMRISEREMKHGLGMSGFDCPNEVIKAMFDEIDEEGNYWISYDELEAWLSAD